MIRSFAAVLLAGLAISAPAVGQQSAPMDTENGRYSFREVGGEVLRLDSRTGQLSTCSKRGAGWACYVVPDERTALENEIARLQDENTKLRRDAVAGVSPPETVPPSSKPEERTLKLPSDAELDRVMSFFEKVWRRLMEMVQNMQREFEKKS
jgi:hypothetical protein